MARDLDLIRKIMFEIDQKEDGHGIVKLELEGYSKEIIQHQLLLMREADLIKAYDFSADNRLEFAPIRLTWIGHDFLDLAKNDNNWNKAKKVAEAAGATTLEIIRKILVDIGTDIALGMLKQS